MKVRPPKEIKDLTKAEVKRINEYYDEILFQKRNEDLVEQQKKWLKFACILLTDKFEFTPEDCYLFLANWRDMYMTNAKFVNNEEQEAYLKEQMDRIFGENGYPEIFIEKLERL